LARGGARSGELADVAAVVRAVLEAAHCGARDADYARRVRPLAAGRGPVGPLTPVADGRLVADRGTAHCEAILVMASPPTPRRPLGRRPDGRGEWADVREAQLTVSLGPHPPGWTADVNGLTIRAAVLEAGAAAGFAPGRGAGAPRLATVLVVAGGATVAQTLHSPPSPPDGTVDE
jgi:hypothetical protein